MLHDFAPVLPSGVSGTCLGTTLAIVRAKKAAFNRIASVKRAMTSSIMMSDGLFALYTRMSFVLLYSNTSLSFSITL